MAAVSTDGSTVCVLIRRLNSSRRRSTPLVVRATPLARWHESEEAIALHLSQHLRMRPAAPLDLRIGRVVEDRRRTFPLGIPCEGRRAAMTAGLDVGFKRTAICVVDEPGLASQPFDALKAKKGHLFTHMRCYFQQRSCTPGIQQRSCTPGIQQRSCTPGIRLAIHKAVGRGPDIL